MRVSLFLAAVLLCCVLLGLLPLARYAMLSLAVAHVGPGARRQVQHGRRVADPLRQTRGQTGNGRLTAVSGGRSRQRRRWAGACACVCMCVWERVCVNGWALAGYLAMATAGGCRHATATCIDLALQLRRQKTDEGLSTASPAVQSCLALGVLAVVKRVHDDLL